MELAGSAYWRKPDPRHVQECIEELGLVGGKARSTSGTTDTLKNLADAEDSLSEVESKSFQRLAGKMLYHSLHDPTIQFDMAMLISGMCQPTVGAMARLMTAWRSHGGSSLTKHQEKVALLVVADHASDETTRKRISCYHIYLELGLIETQSARQATVALSSGELEFYAQNMGCAAVVLVINVDGQTRDPLGLLACQRSDEEIWSGADQTHGYATLLVTRKLEKGLVRAECDRHENDQMRTSARST